MSQSLARKITFGSLLRFAAPTIVMMVFMSMYSMVDGMFVARFVSTDALAAVNIISPVFSVVMAVGIMFGTGASAVIATKMGEGKNEEAKQNFSFIVLVGLIISILFVIILFFTIKPILGLLGATDRIFDLCYDYSVAWLFFIPMAMLQLMFQSFFVTAGKPAFGMFLVVMSGITNIVLDYVFIVPLNMGIQGAAFATGIGMCIPSIAGVIYFFVKRKGTLYFVRPKFNGRVLLKTCTNGSSEMVTNLSSAVMTFLFNYQMLKYVGEDGVAAITVVLYAQFLLVAVYLGYSSGVAPVISYNYGTKDALQLKKIFRISILFVGVLSLITFGLAFPLAKPLTLIFAPAGSEVYNLSVYGFKLFAASFLFMGINVYASAMFTAYSDGKISALLSFLRTFVFILVFLLVLPLAFGVEGVWVALPAAEFLGLAVSVIFIVIKRKKYLYG